MILNQIIAQSTFGLRHRFAFSTRPWFSFPLLRELSQWTTPAILQWRTKTAGAALLVLKRKLAPNGDTERGERKGRRDLIQKEIGEQNYER